MLEIYTDLGKNMTLRESESIINYPTITQAHPIHCCLLINSKINWLRFILDTSTGSKSFWISKTYQFHLDMYLENHFSIILSTCIDILLSIKVGLGNFSVDNDK